MTTETKYFVDAEGRYIGAFVGAAPPAGAIEVGIAPEDARQIWNGSSFEFPALTPEETRAAMPSLTARQLRLGLVDNGFTLSQVQVAIDAIADPVEREKAQIEWEYASEYQRTHPLIEQIGTVLSLSGEQIDSMWNGALGL